MKNFINKIGTVFAGGVVGALLLYVLLPFSVFGGASDVNVLSGTVTHGTPDVASASSTTILSANSGRIYALIVNDCNHNLYLSLGGTATKGSGIRLNAGGGAYEMNTDNMWLGAVSGIASTSDGTDTCNVTTVEN